VRHGSPAAKEGVRNGHGSSNGSQAKENRAATTPPKAQKHVHTSAATSKGGGDGGKGGGHGNKLGDGGKGGGDNGKAHGKKAQRG